MKKFYASVILLLLVSVPLFAGSITRTVTFSENDITFSKVNGYDVVELKGYPALINPGSPRIPRVVEPVLIPPGTKPVSVEILRQDVKNLPGFYNIIPAQADIPLPMPGKTFIPQEIAPDERVYKSDELYPQQEIKVSGYGTKNGFRIAHIEFYPLRYNPKQGRLQFTRSITYRVTYEYAKSISTVPTEKQKEIATTTIKGFVVNPQDITSFAPSVGKQGPSPLVPPGYYEYVIISESPIDTVFQRLADWKTKKGIPATVVTVSWINSNYTGYDLQEKVRNFVIDAYTNWGTIYVLLGGSGDYNSSGQNIVPTRKGWYTNVGGPDGDKLPADLYYSDLDGTWDSDGDHIYGELGDNVDMYADVYVGRASVYTVAMAQNFLYKAFTYEKNPPTGYIKKLMLPTGILWSSYEERPMQDSIARMTPAGWFDAKMYERTGNLSRPGMIDSMNVGYGMGHWEGHGNEVGIYYNGGSTAYLTSGDADGLTNGDKEGIAISIACMCGGWDLVSSGQDCFAEHLVNRVGGGLLATMFNSRYGWGAYVGGYVPGPSERLDTTFYANIFQNNIYHLGDAHGLAKDAWVFYADSGQQYDMTRWCLYENTLFGDPEIPLWTDIPVTMVVTHNATIPMGTTAFFVNVKENDNVTPIQNALVCLQGKTDTGLYATGTTNASGDVSISVTASIPNDTMWVTVTAQNHYPYEGYAIVLDAGMPDVPTIIKALDFGRLPDTQPTLSFYSNDPQGDNLEYRVLWDTDPSFVSPDSSTTPLYPSGNIVDFTFSSSLTDGGTYWWKVKCTDPGGSGIWTQYNTKRSFTIGTVLPANTCSWFQNTSAQFNFNTFNGTVIQGDSVLLVAAGQTVVDTIFQEDFESGLPPTWTVIDGNSDGFQWIVGTTGDLGSYEPPNFGTQYAYYSDDDAGNGVINLNEELISPAMYIPPAAEGLQIQYGYGFRMWENGETYEVKAKFFNGSWGAWNTIVTYTSSVTGTATIDLTPYFPADSVQFEWMYHDETSSSHWGYAAACDNVLLTYSYSLSNDTGTLTGTRVTFNELSTTYARSNWGKTYWQKADGQDSIGIQLEYYNGAIWQLIPDGDLPGNAIGFFTTLANDFVDISALDTVTYSDLRLIGLFYRKGTDAPTEPALVNWEVGNLTTSETTPPLPFSLLSPPDSTLFNISRPTFIWESTIDAGSGLRDYRVYIEGILRHTGTDTTWTSDYDLTEGYNDWYIVAYDSANNGRNSNQTWTVVIDVTPPTTVNLITPADNVYLNNSSVNFVWHKASDNVSGVDHYVIQYALDSGFTQGLFETTTAGTTYAAVLPDTTYYWHVKAVDVATNEGAFSTTWQFEVDTQSPNAPSLTSPVGGIWLTNTSVDFQWTAVTFEHIFGSDKGAVPLSPVRYIIQVDTNAAFTSPLVIDTLTGTSTTKVLSEAFYYWHVMAYDLAGNQGPYASAETFGVDATPPIIDSTVVWTDTGYPGPFEITTKVTDNLSGLDSVALYYRRDEDPSWVMSVMHSSADWFTDTIPTVANSNDTVRYYIRALDVATNASTDPAGAPANFYSFIANMLGVEETFEIPNRFDFKVSTLVKGKATFKLSIPDKSSITLRIYDITGRIVCEPTSGIHSSGRYELSFKPLRKGIYFYKLQSRYKNTTGKLVIF